MKFHYSDVKGSILEIKVDPRKECYNYGKDNAYPSLVEALIEMSVTAKTCVDRVSKAIYGKAFGDIGKDIVNGKNQSLNEVLRIASRQYGKQNAAYLHVRYDNNLDVTSFEVIATTKVRIGKSDDRNYSGKYLIYDNWDKSKGNRIQKDKITVVDRFNPNKEVVKGQIEKAGGINKYQGQLLEIRKDYTHKYSKSDLHPALPDALTEWNSEMFRNRGSVKGFLNTKLLAVQPFKDDDARKVFKKELDDVRGAENSSEVILLESSQHSDDLSSQLHLDDLSGEYNDTLFEYSDKQAEKNICKAFTVPLMLVSQTDNSLFGSSGEMLQEAKVQLWESREEDRDQFEEVFNLLMGLLKESFQGGLKIINPYLDEEEAKEAKSINKQAQATLRGSVGGVQGIISLTEAVKSGTIDKESAVAIVRNIYGYSEKQAKAMIGGFEDEEV